MANIDLKQDEQSDAANVSTEDKDLNNKQINTALHDQPFESNTELNNESADELTAKLEDVDLNTNSSEDEIVESVVVENRSVSVEQSVNEQSGEANTMLSDESKSDKIDESTKQITSDEIESDPDAKTDDDDSQIQQINSTHFTVTNLDHLLSATLTDNSLTDEIKLNVLCSKIVALSADDTVDVQPFADSILKLLIKEDMQKINSPECMQIFFSNYIKHLPKKLLAEILSVLIAVFKKSLLNVDLSKGILLDCLNMYVEESQKNTNENLIKHFLKEIIGQLCNYSCNVKGIYRFTSILR